MQMQVALKVIEGKQTGTLIPLNRQKFLIGREEDCQLRPNSDLVSRHHCVIAVDDFTVRIRDLGSTNGTFVNNQRITTQVVLKQGDLIRIGKLAFEMQIRTIAAVAKTPKVPEPIAIDYTLPSHHALDDQSGSDTRADFAIPSQLDAASEQTTQMFGGDTTIVSGAQVDAAAKPAPQRIVAPALKLPDPSQIPDPVAPAPAAPAPAGGQPSATDSRNSAADIIRQYMQRRPN